MRTLVSKKKRSEKSNPNLKDLAYQQWFGSFTSTFAKPSGVAYYRHAQTAQLVIAFSGEPGN